MSIWNQYADRLAQVLGAALNRTDKWGRYLAEDDDTSSLLPIDHRQTAPVFIHDAVYRPEFGEPMSGEKRSMPLIYYPPGSPNRWRTPTDLSDIPPAQGNVSELIAGAFNARHGQMGDAYSALSPTQVRAIGGRGGMRGGRGSNRRPNSDPFAPAPLPDWWPWKENAPETELKRPPPPEFLRSPAELDGIHEGASAGAIAGGLLGAQVSEMVRRRVRRKTKAERERERVQHMDECDRKYDQDWVHCESEYGMFGKHHPWFQGCVDRAKINRDLCYRLNPLVPRWSDDDSDGVWTIHEKKPAPPQRGPRIYFSDPDDY